MTWSREYFITRNICWVVSESWTCIINRLIDKIWPWSQWLLNLWGSQIMAVGILIFFLFNLTKSAICPKILLWCWFKSLLTKHLVRLSSWLIIVSIIINWLQFIAYLEWHFFRSLRVRLNFLFLFCTSFLVQKSLESRLLKLRVIIKNMRISLFVLIFDHSRHYLVNRIVRLEL